jgi:hypothetical protein
VRGLWPVIRERFLRIAPTVITAMAVGVSAVSVLQLVGPSERMPFSIDIGIDRIQNEEIVLLKSQIESLKGDLYTEGDPVAPVDSSRIIAIEERQKALDDALSDKADRVIALATMRKDLDDLIDNQKEQMISLQQQVSELRTILLSLAGTIVAILLAFVGWLLVRKQSGNE